MLCQICSLAFADELSILKPATFDSRKHHESLATLQVSIEQGCFICKTTWDFRSTELKKAYATCGGFHTKLLISNLAEGVDGELRVAIGFYYQSPKISSILVISTSSVEFLLSPIAGNYILECFE